MSETRVASPLGELRLEVCNDGLGLDTGWVALYESAFPAEQRQPLEEIRAQLAEGTLELDETRDPKVGVVCMTLTEVFGGQAPMFLLACYTATRADLRSLGIGSIHRRRLVELLRAEHADTLGLFSEIESIHEPGIDEATLSTRQRRRAFFLRLGVQPIPIDYRFPSYHPGQEPLRGELLWVPFGDAILSKPILRTILTRIYVEGYRLPNDDPFIPWALETAGV